MHRTWLSLALCAVVLALAGAGCADDPASADADRGVPATSATTPAASTASAARPWDRYEWIWSDEVPESPCIVAVRGAEEARVLRVLRAGPTPIATRSWQDVEEYPAIWVGEQDGWVVVHDATWWACAEPSVVRRLSAGGARAVAFHNDVNGAPQTTLAEDGRVVRSFDQSVWWPDGGTPEERGLPWHDLDVNVDALALLVIERWTGLALDGRWLFDSPLTVYRVPEPDWG